MKEQREKKGDTWLDTDRTEINELNLVCSVDSLVTWALMSFEYLSISLFFYDSLMDRLQRLRRCVIKGNVEATVPKSTQYWGKGSGVLAALWGGRAGRVVMGVSGVFSWSNLVSFSIMYLLLIGLHSGKVASDPALQHQGHQFNSRSLCSESCRIRWGFFFSQNLNLLFWGILGLVSHV